MKTGTDDSSGLNICFSAILKIAAALGCALPLLLHSLPTGAADIAIRQAWSRATPKGAQVAAGYLTIENRGDRTDRLLSASTPVARKVEIHEMRETGGVIRMRPAQDGLAIPPHGNLVLAQGGSHLMFLQLTAPFAESERVPVSLDFERAGQINIALEVGGVGANGPPSAATEGSVAGIASGSDPFFTHIHDPRVMANVTVSPGRSGPVEVVVQLEDPQEQALTADGLSVSLSSPDNTIVLPATSAERIKADTVRARMLVSEAGRWNLTLRIAMMPNEKIEITAPILIE